MRKLLFILLLLCGSCFGTITAITGVTCYPATTCTQSGLAIGDLVLAWAGQNATNTITLTGNHCSSSGNTAFITTSVTIAEGARGLWCISNSTTVAATAGSCTGDCGVLVIAYHSTVGWDTTTVKTATAATAFGAGTNTNLPSVTTTGTNSVIAGYALDEQSGPPVFGAGTGWTAGPHATGHVDFTDYKINQVAASYQPVMTSSQADTNPVITIAMSETGGAGSTTASPQLMTMGVGK